MRASHWKSIVVIAALLQGCAVPSFLRPPTIDEINELIARQEFGEALQELHDIPDAHPDRESYRALEVEVRTLAEEYAGVMISRSQAIEDEGDWTSAIALLVEARQKYPMSERLDQAEGAMLDRQKSRLNAVDDNLVLFRAEMLLQELPLRQEIARIDPYNLTARRYVADIQEELSSIVERLCEFGENAFEEGEPFSAESFISVAARIEETPRVAQALLRLESEKDLRAAEEMEEIRRIQEAEAATASIQEEARRREEEARIQGEKERRQRQLDQRLREVREALDQQKLLDARRLLNAAEILSPGSSTIQTLREELQQKITRQVDILLRRGNELYTNGHFEQAKLSWVNARELDPENETVSAQLERVDRVLANLREISTRNLRPPPPPPPDI